MKNMVRALILLGCIAAISVAQENLLKNSGFEEGKHFWLWSFSDDGGAAAEWSIDSTSGEAHEGTKLCRINVTAVSDENWHVQLKDPTWEAESSYVYHFSFWGKADAAHSATISVYGANTGADAYRTGSPITFTTEWKQFHQMFIADYNGPGVHNFAIVVGSEIGVYDIDGASVVKKEPSGLYPNGGFEADGATWNFWQQTGDDGAALTTASIDFIEDATAREGTKVCKITVDEVSVDTAGNAINWYAQLQDGSWTADSGWTYTYSFLGKADANFTVHLCTGAGSTRDYKYLGGNDLMLTEEWQLFTYSYTSEISGTDSVNFNMYVGGQTGTMYLDSITLVAQAPIKTVSPNSSRRTAYSPVFSIKVLPEQLRLVSSEILEPSSMVSVYSIAGRLFTIRPIVAAGPGHTCDLPRPPSGSWIVRVNSQDARRVVIP